MLFYTFLYFSRLFYTFGGGFSMTNAEIKWKKAYELYRDGKDDGSKHTYISIGKEMGVSKITVARYINMWLQKLNKDLDTEQKEYQEKRITFFDRLETIALHHTEDPTNANNSLIRQAIEVVSKKYALTQPPQPVKEDDEGVKDGQKTDRELALESILEEHGIDVPF